MVPMKALVGFSDAALATEYSPSGGVAGGSPFNAPDAETANRFEAEGLAVRVKPDAPDKA